MFIPHLAGKVVVEQFHSPSLEGNPLGDPAVRYVPVYLPPGYDADVGRRYPTIYWLHGFSGTALGNLSYSPWSRNIPEIVDGLIVQGRMPEVVVVMPDGFTRFGGSQYLNSSATGQYEDSLVRDLVPYIDGRYRTIPAAASRGIAGKSSGGYGALVLAMRHPDVFGAVASHSGDMYFELCYAPDFPKAVNTMARFGGLDGFLRQFPSIKNKPRDVMDTVNILAMAMAYSPNPARPPWFFDLPFDAETAERDEAVWARWLELDPIHMVARHVEHLKQLRLIYFEAGTRDEYQLHLGARILKRRLDMLGVPYEHQEFEDGHMGIWYRYEESFVRLGRTLAS